jgi:membrane protein DedA with SNARE-associated domain/rhodanese-related sulfurtransferase
MDSLLQNLAQHGYAILMLIVFVEAIGLPVPAAVALLIAGGASATGALQPFYALGGALLAMLAGDTIMFLLGRYTGWWLLGVLCRVSLNPESCILSSADSFYKRGRTVLVIAKFIPGINTMAPPLAGAMNMRFAMFLRLDLVGTLLYVGSYFAVGFIFSGALEMVTSAYKAFGRVVGAILLVLLAGYIGFVLWRWLRERLRLAVPMELPLQVAAALAAGAPIYDVRSHGYLDANAIRVKGSKRLDPHTLNRLDEAFPQGHIAYLYCTCYREATSARVARELQARGVRVAVLKGGLRAWRKDGLPVEPVPAEELAQLPLFG